MTHVSILLIRIYAIISLVLTSFASVSISPTAEWLRAYPAPQIFPATMDVETAPDETSIDFAGIEQPIADTSTYLPVLMNNYSPPRYIGTITDNGAPVSGHEVELRFYDEDTDTWSTIDIQVTNASGTYSFNNLPVLTTGLDKYYVRWLNNLGNPDHLSSYYCDTIDADNVVYTPLSCDFNIHNVFHLSPNNDALVLLPNTFSWTLRPTTNDSYELDIADMVDDIPWWWTDPPLGYTNTYQLTSLPADFQTNQEYGWFMAVFGPNGYGFSYYYRTITFQNSGNVIIGPETPIDNLRLSQRKEREMISPVEE
jgi:hypothetical protein